MYVGEYVNLVKVKAEQDRKLVSLMKNLEGLRTEKRRLLNVKVNH